MLAYGSAAGFRHYHALRGRETAAWTDVQVEAKLILASEWLDGRYRGSFGGNKVGSRVQVREWPRVGATDRDGYAIADAVVPTEIEYATYEGALRELENAGSLSVDWTPPKYKRVSVDGAVSVEYASFDTAADAQSRFIAIDYLLAPILSAGGAISSLSGAIHRK